MQSESYDMSSNSVLPVAIDVAPRVRELAGRFMGAAFSTAGIVLLVFPFGMHTTTEVLCKLMVALVLGFIGVALWQARKPSDVGEMEVDLNKRELRLHPTASRSKDAGKTVKFSDFTKLQLDGDTFRFWAGSDAPLTALTLEDPQANQLLRAALRESGHSI